MRESLRRWKYRFITWFFNQPDSMSRRCEVENTLLRYAANNASPTPAECRALAYKLGVPTWYAPWDKRRTR